MEKKTFEQKVREILLKYYNDEDMYKELLEAHAEEIREIKEEVFKHMQKSKKQVMKDELSAGDALNEVSYELNEIIDKKIGGEK